MRRLWTPTVAPLAGCGLGLLFVFHPILFSGLRLTHGGLGDAQLIAYTLEHGFRWLIQMPGHENFWNPPIFFPYPNVSAFTDVLLGVGPFYWIWRAFGLAPDSSFQLWMLTVWALNYAAGYFLLRKGFFVGSIGAACGAWVFAFGASVQGRFGHPQLAPLFYVAMAFAAILQLFPRQSTNQEVTGQGWWIAVFFICVTLQAYSCFYTFFFFGLLLAIACLWALALPGLRLGLMRAVGDNRWALLFGTVFSALALGYLASHYLEVAARVGFRTFFAEDAPSWTSWIRVNGRSYFHGWLNGLASAQGWSFWSGRSGMGLIPLALSAFAFYHHRRNAAIRLLLLACVTMIVLATSWGGFSLWKYVHAFLPGAAALRALGRVGIILALPAAIGVALGAQALLDRRRWVMVAVVMMLCLAELLHGHIWIDKYEVRHRVAQLAELVDPESEAFFMVCRGPQDDPHVEELAEWVGLATGVPTVNGRYGNYPPEWGLQDAQASAVLTDDQRQEYQAALRRWSDETGLDYDRVQWIEYERVRIPRVRYRIPGLQEAKRRTRKPKSAIP